MDWNRAKKCEEELATLLRSNVGQKENIASVLTELEKKTTEARMLNTELRSKGYECFSFNERILRAEAALVKLRDLLDEWLREVLEHQRDLLARLQNGGSSGYKSDLIDLNEAIVKLGEIPCFMNNNLGNFRVLFAIQNVAKKRNEIINDIVTAVENDQTRLSQVIAGKPGIDILGQIMRQELPELTEKFNFVKHQLDTSQFPTEFNKINLGEVNLDKLRERIDRAIIIQQASDEEKELAALVVNNQLSNASQTAQLLFVEAIKTSDIIVDDEARKFLEKQIEKLESALARLRSKSRVDERGRGQEEERTAKRQQDPDRSMDVNDHLRIRISELEHAIAREVLRAEEERQEEQVQEDNRLVQPTVTTISPRVTVAHAVSPMAGGLIRLDVPMLTELKQSVESSRIWIAGLPWHLCVNAECSVRTGNVKMLSVFIFCNSESKETDWSCDSKLTFTLLAQKAGHKAYSKTLSRMFKFNEDKEGIASFMICDDVLNSENGFIRSDDGIAIEASITVKDVIGVESTPLNDFSTPQPNITDIVLLVGDKRLHVGKQLLSTLSPIFYAKFYKDPVEKDKKEVILDKVVFEEFLELLHVIYPPRKATVECLLRLGDRFMMEDVVSGCSQFLCGPESNGIPFEKKLFLADKYHLGRLQFLCLESLKTVEEVMALKGKREYVEFSGEMKTALFERIFKLTR